MVLNPNHTVLRQRQDEMEKKVNLLEYERMQQAKKIAAQKQEEAKKWQDRERKLKHRQATEKLKEQEKKNQSKLKQRKDTEKMYQYPYYCYINNSNRINITTTTARLEPLPLFRIERPLLQLLPTTTLLNTNWIDNC